MRVSILFAGLAAFLIASPSAAQSEPPGGGCERCSVDMWQEHSASFAHSFDIWYSGIGEYHTCYDEINSEGYGCHTFWVETLCNHYHDGCSPEAPAARMLVAMQLGEEDIYPAISTRWDAKKVKENSAGLILESCDHTQALSVSRTLGITKVNTRIAVASTPQLPRASVPQ